MTLETDASIGGNATLKGGDAIAVVNGTATFSNLQLDQLGIGYTLRATATGPLSVVSAAFTIL
jgi:hypothetical protein